MLRSRGGVWMSSKEARDERAEVTLDSPDLGYEQALVQIPRAQREGFYQGISNALLWPLLHSFPTTERIGEAPWEDYLLANHLFAEKLGEVCGARDRVWIHDYHLMLLPGALRRQKKKARVGWFCHVPWPSPELFGVLPWRKQILEGLLGANLIAFHTKDFVKNFLGCVARFTDATVTRGEVQFDGRTIQVAAHPIGIDFDRCAALSMTPTVVEQATEIRSSVGGRRIILGVDRLDYTKGIPERMLGYERFLTRNPKRLNDTVFVQVMVPSRTDVAAYGELKDEVDRLVGDINGRFGATGRAPIHYLYRNLDPEALFAHYRAADVALVTPLRDGMNLVAHEYVAAHTDTPGHLILSEFAGAASFLKGAFMVNPHDLDGIANALSHAHGLDDKARTQDMKTLGQQVRRLDVHGWAKRFLEQLEQ